MRALALIAALACGWPASALAGGPVVVELYTSQNCETCLRANAVVGGLAARPDVLPLTLPVDYWDYLGWRDSFAHPYFAARQRQHQQRLRLKGMQTPLVVVDGAYAASGLDAPKLMRTVRFRHAARDPEPRLRFAAEGRRALVAGGGAPPGGGELWLVRYDPRVQTVQPERGPNRGRQVHHRNVVREMVRLGWWSGRSRTYAVPPPQTPGLRSALIMQGVRDGRVLAVGTR